MFRPVTGFFKGFLFHPKGIRFGLQHGSFLLLSLFPFFLTLLLYGIAFYVFTLYVDDLLRAIWDLDPDKSSVYLSWLHTSYYYVTTILLYLIVLVIMFYVFIILVNIVASPIYDRVSTKYGRIRHLEMGLEPATSPGLGIPKVIKEETKKALFMLALPLFLLFIPWIGGPLAFITAAVFIAWDYTDYSLSKDHPFLKDRVRIVWRYKFHFLGFGFPLLIPFVNILMIPFAILGATKLYYDEIKVCPKDYEIAKT
jgi:CysZ protein